jgi:transcriptional regulator with XRE-family HTH domain
MPIRTKTTGEKLRELRGIKGKKEVSNAIGISFSSYVKYERDERTPSDEVKVRIAKYYGKSVESIFFA